MEKKVIVIGGGIAGLSAGIYAQKCGFNVTILESHNIAGGNCTSWKRGGYLFEGGMHWLSGSGSNENLHKLWRHVGALDDSVKIHYPEPFMEFDYEGTPIRLYRNVDTTERHLIELSPADTKEIKRLCNNIRRVKNLSMPVTDIPGVKATKKNRLPLSLIFSALSAMRVLASFSKISGKQYISRFTHEGIRDMLRSCTYENSGVLPLFFTMGTLARGDGGFPEGGSLPFAGRMAKTFMDLGGEILFNTRAERVIVEAGKDGRGTKAAGVMAGDKQLTASAVIVTADTMAIDNLFENPPKAAWLEQMKAVTEPTMVTFVCLGINADLKKYPDGYIFRLKRQIKLAEQSYEHLSVSNYASDPVYSPAGKTALTVQLPGDTWDFWKKAKEENRYKEEKQKIANEIISALEAQIPQIKGQVEVWDVATPLTYERYCANWKGSWMTEMTSGMKLKSYPSVIKGLSGVYFAGHRMMPPGGLPVALMSGRTAVQQLCRDTGTLFISEG
jgi:phytoene dehydrogenase-like protein